MQVIYLEYATKTRYVPCIGETRLEFIATLYLYNPTVVSESISCPFL